MRCPLGIGVVHFEVIDTEHLAWGELGVETHTLIIVNQTLKAIQHHALDGLWSSVLDNDHNHQSYIPTNLTAVSTRTFNRLSLSFSPLICTQNSHNSQNQQTPQLHLLSKTHRIYVHTTKRGLHVRSMC